MSSQNRPLEDIRTTLTEYTRILRYRWRCVLLGVGVVGSVAFWASQYLPRRYVASTIFERRDDTVLRNLISKNSPYSFDNLKTSLTIDMTGSRALAEAAVKLGLLPAELVPPEGPLSEAALKALDRTLTEHGLQASVKLLQTSPNLDTIQLDCTANSPRLARAFAVELRDRYIARTRDRITEMLLSTQRFFQSEIERFERELAQRQESLSAPFREFPGVDPTDLTGVGTRLETLRQNRERLLERKVELETQVAARERFLLELASLEAQNATTTRPAPVPPPASAESRQALRRSLEDAERELADALTVRRMTREHPAVKALQRKVAALREALAESDSTPAPGALAASARAGPAPPSADRLRVELELEALRRQLEMAQANFSRADDQVRRFTALYEQLLNRGDELRRLSDQAQQDALTIAMWREHLAQLNRILAAEKEQRGVQFALLEEPKDSGRAVWPRAAPVFALCVGSGLLAAAIFVALAELRDHSFRSVGQVARSLGIPVLECVSEIPTPQVRRRRRVSRLIWASTATVLLALFLFSGSLTYVSLERPELYRKAVLRLQRVLPQELFPLRAVSMR
jgi:hypothetical protein